ncbi:conserved exported hypothetical protein [Sulfurovum sp. enrichment culture clone C5]|uniref:Outer membrane porin n=1 Tax=Sulfurovum sp. enrichment culture clone C5 TaxID=497650 RepID=A0A0S4XMW3_9BACT|nr:conserved exported hypothetical protein [Sulfurovum sp. enrichment culture clone C5]
MKKTLLLSMIVSTMIFAGGDIAPVEPAVVAPVAPVAESGWKFSGQGVFYYETSDFYWNGPQQNLFNQDSALANVGLQLTATNDNLVGGVGFGVQLNGLGTLGLEEDVVSHPMQMAGDSLNSAYISQLYLTYGINNTSLKVGRQELPKALSPFAFSEDWNVFKNTFDAALVVNTDIPNTTLVGAWVRDANQNGYAWYYLHGWGSTGNMNEFNKANGSDGIWMLTAQNKSIENLTLTGSLYYANDYANILWLDAGYDAGFANIGLQGGAVWLDAGGTTDTKAFGIKASKKLFDVVNASVAYSHINDSSAGIFNVGGATSTLYTSMLAEQYAFGDINDNNKFVLRADADVLGGNIGGALGYTDFGDDTDTKEFDISYSKKITDNIDASATYAYIDYRNGNDFNIIRLIGRYNF